jgi:hypothetical protein
MRINARRSAAAGKPTAGAEPNTSPIHPPLARLLGFDAPQPATASATPETSTVAVPRYLASRDMLLLSVMIQTGTAA